ncbi:phosphoglycerate kinase [Candidatus Woesearchaeota archaeon]|nr:phosphoglycerate kinase [Candidatus Woesearchaeota archaeon]
MAEYRRTVKDIDVKGKYVFLRAGLDIKPDLTKDLLDPARVPDDSRIRDILPTLKYLIEHDAKVILAAGWCGRPEGVDPALSMAPVAKRLEEILKEEGILKYGVLIAPDCFKDRKPKSVYQQQEEVRRIVQSLLEGQVVVLENVRYDAGSNQNNPELAKFYASLAEIYVNEAETQNHRPEATIATTPLEISRKGGEVVYGLQYAKVLDTIGAIRALLEQPERGRLVFGLCGLKIESGPGITSKVTVARRLMSFMDKRDTLITGGGVPYTFLLADHSYESIHRNREDISKMICRYDLAIKDITKQTKDSEAAKKLIEKAQEGKSREILNLLGVRPGDIKSLVGDSYVREGQEGEQIFFAYEVLQKAKERGITVVTALDHTIANGPIDKGGMLPDWVKIKIFNQALNIPGGWRGVGPGPRTINAIVEAISKASIYIQSGPYSIEDRRVEDASSPDKVIFAAVGACQARGGMTIGAGGDTFARIHARKAENSFSAITNAGGATLELLQSGTSPGKEAVEKAQEIRRGLGLP